jgi:hypothetical protein
MRGKTPLSFLLRGFILVVLCVLLAIVLVAVIGWWSGWTVLADFQRAIQLAGLVLIGLGFFWIGRKQEKEKDSTKITMEEKGPENLQRFIQRYGLMLVFFIAGGVCLLIGWLM